MPNRHEFFRCRRHHGNTVLVRTLTMQNPSRWKISAALFAKPGFDGSTRSLSRSGMPASASSVCRSVTTCTTAVTVHKYSTHHAGHLMLRYTFVCSPCIGTAVGTRIDRPPHRCIASDHASQESQASKVHCQPWHQGTREGGRRKPTHAGTQRRARPPRHARTRTPPRPRRAALHTTDSTV